MNTVSYWTVVHRMTSSQSGSSTPVAVKREVVGQRRREPEESPQDDEFFNPLPPTLVPGDESPEARDTTQGEQFFEEYGVEHSVVNPSVLRTQAQNHPWILGAVAELIDNAYDVHAKHFWIDVEPVQMSPMKDYWLIFTDDGPGMDRTDLKRMLSFGASKKEKAIGQFGVGFKSGSMRLGDDAIVFTRHTKTMSVGFLSQTYTKGLQELLIPIVSFDIAADLIAAVDNLDLPSQNRLGKIMQHSPFKTKPALMEQFKRIKSTTGTCIIVYNLRRREDPQRTMELDVTTDPRDIHIRGDDGEVYIRSRSDAMAKSDPIEEDYSLRKYCEVLFIEPKASQTQVILRGERVRVRDVLQGLHWREDKRYKPLAQDGVTFPATVAKMGYSEALVKKGLCGMFIYYRGRLIRSYMRVGLMTTGAQHGLGVVGTVEADFCQPENNKQNFLETEQFTMLKKFLKQFYNKEYHGKLVKMKDNFKVDQDAKNLVADAVWVTCDNCNKWRKASWLKPNETIPDQWYCWKSPDPKYNRCDIPQEKTKDLTVKIDEHQDSEAEDGRRNKSSEKETQGSSQNRKRLHRFGLIEEEEEEEAILGSKKPKSSTQASTSSSASSSSSAAKKPQARPTKPSQGTSSSTSASNPASSKSSANGSAAKPGTNAGGGGGGGGSGKSTSGGSKGPSVSGTSSSGAQGRDKGRDRDTDTNRRDNDKREGERESKNLWDLMGSSKAGEQTASKPSRDPRPQAQPAGQAGNAPDWGGASNQSPASDASVRTHPSPRKSPTTQPPPPGVGPEPPRTLGAEPPRMVPHAGPGGLLYPPHPQFGGYPNPMQQMGHMMPPHPYMGMGPGVNFPAPPISSVWRCELYVYELKSQRFKKVTDLISNDRPNCFLLPTYLEFRDYIRGDHDNLLHRSPLASFSVQCDSTDPHFREEYVTFFKFIAQHRKFPKIILPTMVMLLVPSPQLDPRSITPATPMECRLLQ